MRVLITTIVLIGIGCGNDGGKPKPDFVVGVFSEHNITGNTPIEDNTIGGTLMGDRDGILKIAKILETNRPVVMGGEGFAIVYQSDGTLTLSIERTAEVDPFLWYYGPALFSTYDPIEVEALWQPIAPQDATSSTATFDLTPYLMAREEAEALAKSSDPSTRSSGGEKLIRVWKNKQFKKSGLWSKLEQATESTRQTIIDLVNMMSPTLQTTVKPLVDGKYQPSVYMSWFSEASYYHPFVIGTNWNSTTRTLDPYFCYNLNTVQPGTIAHEVGHYLSHILLGDEIFAQLAQQAIKVHNFGEMRPQRQMLEEYAIFAEYALYQTIRGLEVIEYPHQIREFTTKSRIAFDWPRMEGFAAALLSRLHYDSPTIKSYERDEEDQPALETLPNLRLSIADIYDILNKKPLTVDELYTEIASFLQESQRQESLPVIAERIGWSYPSKVTILNWTDSPMAEVEVNWYKQVDGIDYVIPSAKTDKNGLVEFDRLFPSTEVGLRVNNGCETFTKTLAVPTLDTKAPTNTSKIDLGSISIEEVKPASLDGSHQWFGAIIETDCSKCWGHTNDLKIPYSLGSKVNVTITDGSIVIGPGGTNLLSHEEISGSGTYGVNTKYGNCATDSKYLFDIDIEYKHKYNTDTPPDQYTVSGKITSSANQMPRFAGSANFKSFAYDEGGTQTTTCSCQFSFDTQITFP